MTSIDIMENKKNNKDIERIEYLVQYLNKQNHQYYVLCSPSISDYEFDMLLKELETLESKTGHILPESPTQRVGSDLQKGFNEVDRKRIMGSIANCYDKDELAKWMKSLSNVDKFLLEPKYDGLSCSLIYRHGLLVQASTRGSGFKGTDITLNAKTIKSIPLRLFINQSANENYKNIYIPDEIEIRGEILLPKSELSKINKDRVEKNLPAFANERNAAAGSIKQLDPSITASRNLIFRPYAVYCDDVDFSEKYITEQHNMLDIAYIFGFSKPFYIICQNTDAALKGLDEFESNFLHNQDYCMDGCVIKIDSYEKQLELGYTQKVPKWAKAFKFKQEQVSTKLKNVEWQIGRTGKLTPVAILDPIDIDGTVVSKASLNNIDYINDLDLHINDYVFVERGGGVIPKVVGVDYSKQ